MSMVVAREEAPYLKVTIRSPLMASANAEMYITNFAIVTFAAQEYIIRRITVVLH